MQLSTILSLALAIGASAVPTSHGGSYGKLHAVSAASDFPLVAKLQGSIEGVSVDAAGNIYCIDANSFNNLSENKVVYSRPGLNTTFHQFAGSRITRSLGALISEVVGKKIVSLPIPGACNTTDAMPAYNPPSPAWLQPNDLAHNDDESAFYFSGMNYTGGYGDLYYSLAPTKQSSATKIDLPEGMGRANGIEVVGKHLYLTSAINKVDGENITVTAASVWRFDLAAGTGEPLPGTAKEVKKFYDAEKDEECVAGLIKAQMDPDGMRADVDGFMYSTLNAFGAVLRWNTKRPSEQQLIELPTVKGPANLELGGKDGKTLVAVGGCKKGAPGIPEGQLACVDKVEDLPAPGRAWSLLQKKKTGY